ncbi:hypothetical protein Gpo141_00005946 [Globisporangium polare]
MSFLLGDAYDSGSSSESDVESHREQETAPASKQSVDAPPAVILPSADSVLADVSASTASFLAPKSAQSSAAAAIVEIDVFKENERVEALEATERATERQSRREKYTPPQDVSVKKRARAPEAEAPPAKKDKLDAKERVKAQRTKGQAGIGSDFRSWKSETEMSMRQQFD